MIDLRGLTLVRPMGGAIIFGTKRIENRPNNLPKAMRGVPTVVAVHSGKKWSPEYQETVLRIDGVARVKYPENAHVEGIIGLMRLTGRVFTEDNRPTYIHEDGAPRLNPWWGGPFGYEIADVVALPQSIACPGTLGWWRVPTHLVAAIGEMVPAGWL